MGAEACPPSLGGRGSQVPADPESDQTECKLSDPGDHVLHVGDGDADGGHGAVSAEPGINLELVAALLQLEVEVEVLELAH